MRTVDIAGSIRPAILPLLVAAVAHMPLTAPAWAGDDNGAAGESTSKPEKAVVVPYKSRPAPTHRVTLRDERIFFLSRLEKRDQGYILHTLEGETIEVGNSEIAEIVEFVGE